MEEAAQQQVTQTHTHKHKHKHQHKHKHTRPRTNKHTLASTHKHVEDKGVGSMSSTPLNPPTHRRSRRWQDIEILRHTLSQPTETQPTETDQLTANTFGSTQTCHSEPHPAHT
jgi:hypothetical protein